MNRTFILKRIDPMSAGKLLGAIYAVLGLLIGAIVSLLSVLRVMKTPADADAVTGALFGVGAVILIPLCYGILGWIGGALGAALFNIFAGMVGGLTVNGEVDPRT